MLEEIKKEISTAFLPLLSGIVGDSRILVEQEIALMKCQFKEELVKTKSTIIALSIGMSLCLVSILLVCFGLVEVISSNFPSILRWQSYCLLGVIIGIQGLFLLQYQNIKKVSHG